MNLYEISLYSEISQFLGKKLRLMSSPCLPVLPVFLSYCLPKTLVDRYDQS